MLKSFIVAAVLLATSGACALAQTPDSLHLQKWGGKPVFDLSGQRLQILQVTGPEVRSLATGQVITHIFVRDGRQVGALTLIPRDENGQLLNTMDHEVHSVTPTGTIDSSRVDPRLVRTETGRNACIGKTNIYRVGASTPTLVMRGVNRQ